MRLEYEGSHTHTNFFIVNGQQLFLTDSNGVGQDSMVIPADLMQNMSWGRSPNGIGQEYYYMAATPGAPNGTNGIQTLPPRRVLTLNLYQNVYWQSFQQYKTNLHTHTNNSDGSLDAHIVVDHYYNAGYKILSITDHNLITYPWTSFSSIKSNWQNRDPQLLGMLDVKGNELSAAHHTGSYINVVPGSGANLNVAFDTMTAINGLGAFKHPGRYWSKSTTYAPTAQYSPDWYQNYYMQYPVLVGMEVYNQGDRYPNDRVLWDELLTSMMPGRPIWGYSNDDMHSASHL
jgi:hypothetical protein